MSWQAAKDWVASTFGKTILGAAAYVGAITVILKAVGREQWLVPALIASAAAAVLLGCAWIVSNPPDRVALTIDEPPPLFSRGRRTAAGVLMPMILVVASILVCATKPRPPVAAVRDLLTRMHTARTSLQRGDANAIEIYRRYAEARRLAGRAFWTDPEIVPNVQAHEIVRQNAVLADLIGEPIVPSALAADATWAPDDIERHLTVVLNRCREADRERERILALRSGDTTPFEKARELNERLCRYWELVLGEPDTYLTAGGGATFRAADQHLTQSLPSLEKKGHSCFAEWF